MVPDNVDGVRHCPCTRRESECVAVRRAQIGKAVAKRPGTPAEVSTVAGRHGPTRPASHRTAQHELYRPVSVNCTRSGSEAAVAMTEMRTGYTPYIQCILYCLETPRVAVTKGGGRRRTGAGMATI